MVYLTFGLVHSMFLTLKRTAACLTQSLLTCGCKFEFHESAEQTCLISSKLPLLSVLQTCSALPFNLLRPLQLQLFPSPIPRLAPRTGPVGTLCRSPWPRGFSAKPCAAQTIVRFIIPVIITQRLCTDAAINWQPAEQRSLAAKRDGRSVGWTSGQLHS